MTLPNLSKYSLGFQSLSHVLSGLSEKVRLFVPSKSSWCIQEVVVHLADTEAQSYTRFRSILADPSAVILNHEEQLWNIELNNSKASYQESLLLIKTIRRLNSSLLRSLSPEQFQKYGVHSIRGKESLSDLVEIYSSHMESHISQIKRNIITYNKTQEL